MAGNPTEYPEFVEGQTLTALELGQLSTHLRDRDTLLGALIGFGINAGLAGSFGSGAQASTLTVAPGLAIDQAGEPLVVPGPRTISFPAALDTTQPGFPFIAQPGEGGFSVVLVAKDTEAPAPPCNEAGCAGHAKIHTRDVDLLVVNGRLTGTYMDFAQEFGVDPILGVEPLELTPLPGAAAFTTLRNKIRDRLRGSPGVADDLIPEALIAAFETRTVDDGELSGIRGYKFNWLNAVLNATVDLIRVQTLLALGWPRDATRPGVVLGWARQVQGVWTFDCRYRHAWEPPRGFTEAFLGGSCADPAKLFRDRLEALITGFAPPNPPPAGGGGGGGKLEWFDDIHIIPFIPQLVWEEPPPKDPLGPIAIEILAAKINPVLPALGLTEVADAGGLIGFAVDEVEKTVVKSFAAETGKSPTVLVVTEAESLTLDGFQPSTYLAGDDDVVLVQDAGGRVTGVGRVPLAYNVKRTGEILPAARTALVEATAAIDKVETISSDVAAKVTVFDGALLALKSDVGRLGTRVDDIFAGGEFESGGFAFRISSLEKQIGGLSLQGERIARIEGVVNTGKIAGLSADATLGVKDFTRTALIALQNVNAPQSPTFARHVAAAEEAQVKLEKSIELADEKSIAESTVGVMESLRTAIKAAGVPDVQARDLDAQLRSLRGRIG